MLKISLQVDSLELLRKLPKAEKRIAFGVAYAINETAKRIQQAERANVRRRLRVRKTAFIERQAAVIKPFASPRQGRPYAEISVGQRPRLLLSVFERGGRRLPFKGKHLAVPVTGGPARPSFGKSVPPEWTFQKLKLRKTRPSGTFTAKGRPRRQKGGKGVRFGERRTYLVPDVGVFQRGEGVGARSRLVYVFVPPAKLRARLQFIRTATRSADRWFRRFMEEQTAEALRRAGFK